MSKVKGRDILAWAILQVTEGGNIRRSIELHEPNNVPENCIKVPCGDLTQAPDPDPTPAEQAAAGVVPVCVAEAMGRVYLAGFLASGEGWNGEALQDQGRSPISDPKFVRTMVADIQRLVPELAEAMQPQPVEASAAWPSDFKGPVVRENPDDTKVDTVETTATLVADEQASAELEAANDQIAQLQTKLQAIRRAANMAKNTAGRVISAEFVLKTLES